MQNTLNHLQHVLCKARVEPPRKTEANDKTSIDIYIKEALDMSTHVAKK